MLTVDQISILTNRAKTFVPDKGAFSCMRGEGCSKDRCPAWLDIVWNLYNTELKIHSEKNLVGCSFILEPILLADVVSTTYTGIDSNKQVADSFNRIAQNLDEHTKQVKVGMVSLMKLIGAKDIQRVLIENEELRNILNEKVINQTDRKQIKGE